MNIGLPELLIVLVVVLLLLGPKRLPALGRSMGDGLRGFRESLRSRHEDQELSPAPPAPPAPSPPPAEPEALDGDVVPESPPRR